MSAGESEPLDCDEAAYAYIGHRILQGGVMYRDLTENKPPLGYWLFTIVVAIDGIGNKFPRTTRLFWYSLFLGPLCNGEHSAEGPLVKELLSAYITPAHS
jgi:hypothetical protein